MIDQVKRQLATVERDWLKLHTEGVSQEAWAMGVNARRFPVGARYFYALQAVYITSNQNEAAE